MRLTWKTATVQARPRSTRFLLLHTSALLVGALVFVCSACTPERSYFEPTELPSDQIKSALVRTPSPIYRDGKDLILIETVDGQPPTFLEDKVIVAPGEHIFQVRLELRHDDPASPDTGYATRANLSLTFETEAEGEYLIDAVEDENGLWVWAVDLETDITVAGRPPVDLPPGQRVRPIWRDTK
ncbi:MAG: hypothetical protein KDD69_06705 [Bdellovibrionales bacterium]|nr:hypothetical protein [Bdellovibrionales bacterium]